MLFILNYGVVVWDRREEKSGSNYVSKHTNLGNLCCLFYTLFNVVASSFIIFKRLFFKKTLDVINFYAMLICYYYVYRVVFKYPYYFRLVSLVTGSIGQPGFNQPIKTSVLWWSKYDIICNQKKIRIFSKYKTNMDAYYYLILCLVKWNRMFLKHLK